MNQNEINVLHQKQLIIMDEIHRVCQEEHIEYYLLFGSVLGAVRHKGFIPWDYDIDCGMLRPDYERFANICKKNKLNSNFIYYDSKNVYGNIHVHAIVSMRNTTFKTRFSKYNKEKFNYGIYVDIFPIDFTSDDEKEQKEHLMALSKIFRMIYIKRHYNHSNSVVKRFLKWVLSLRYITKDWNQLYDELDKESCKFNTLQTNSVIQNTAFCKKIIPRDCFRNPPLVEFEDRFYYIPNHAHEYLSRIYGDYMTPPPLEARIKCMEYVSSFSINDESINK